MTRLIRVPAFRLLPALVFAAAMALTGCEQPAPAVDHSIPYDPAKAKSQEDSMRKAMEESLKGAKK